MNFSSVTSFAERELVVEEDLGVAWPVPIYRNEFGDVGHKQDGKWKELIESVEIREGCQTEVIVLGSKFGSNPGCFKMSSRFTKGVRRDDELGNSINKRTGNMGLKQCWKQGLNKLGTVDLTIQDDAVLHKQTSMKEEEQSQKGSVDGSDSDIELDYLAGTFKKSTAKAKANRGEKRPRSSGGDPTQERVPKQAKMPRGSPSNPGKLSKQVDEIAKSQAVISEGQRWLDQIGQDGIGSHVRVTHANVKSCLDKLIKRLTKATVSTMIANYGDLEVSQGCSRKC